jgi:hemoglobin/transferrin/lactoferrin receptor protein
MTTTNSKGEADISDFKQVSTIQLMSLGYQTAYVNFDLLKAAEFKYYLQPSNLNLHELVISGTRWAQSSDEVPSKITTISSKDVTLLNPQTAADLLSVSGQVFVQKSQQGGGSPMIRGFATNRLLYTVDGVRMNTAIFRSGNIQNVINLDPFATQSTEVLFGPGSVIYGSDAIGGVMSFQTLKPKFSLTDSLRVSGKADLRYSSANQEKTGHFDVNLGWKKWALVTSFSSWNYDDLRQGSHGPEDYVKPYHVERINDSDQVVFQDDDNLQVPTAYSQINLMQKVRFKPNTKWDFEYGFHYSNTTSYGRYDRHNRERNGLPRYAEWDYGPQKWMMNNFTITHKNATWAYDQVVLRLAVQNFEESRIDRNLNAIDRNETQEKVDAYSANLDFRKTISAKNDLFYGVEFVENVVNSTGSITDITTDTETVGPARYPNSKWYSIAAYVNEEYHLRENLILQAGMRYNQFILDADFSNNTDFYPFPFTTASINDGALTGSLGAVYRPTPTLVFSGNFGTAFRAPNVDDMGKVFDSEPGSVVIPNPDLTAEYAYNVDLGVAKVFSHFLKIDVTGYYTILNNAMVRRNSTLNGQDSIMYEGELSQVQSVQNAAQATVYGIQTGVELKITKSWSFSSNLNYQVGEEEMDDGTISPSRHAAPLFGMLRLKYTHKKWNIELYNYYQGLRKAADLAVEERSKDEIYAKDADGNNYSPAWYTLNLKAMYSISTHFLVNVGIENITDQRYRAYSSGVSGAGRNFVISARVLF